MAQVDNSRIVIMKTVEIWHGVESASDKRAVEVTRLLEVMRVSDGRGNLGEDVLITTIDALAKLVIGFPVTVSGALCRGAVTITHVSASHELTGTLSNDDRRGINKRMLMVIIAGLTDQAGEVGSGKVSLKVPGRIGNPSRPVVDLIEDMARHRTAVIDVQVVL